MAATNMHTSFMYVTLDHNTRRTGIFVAIANNTLYMGQNYRFLSYAKNH